MAGRMITVRHAGMRFTYRVAGVAVRNGNVLLHRIEGEEFWCLPGGRVELGESAEQALVREMDEEIGVRCGVGRLLWVVENFFQVDGTSHHELGLYFLLNLPDGFHGLDSEVFRGREGNLELLFRWFQPASLQTCRLYPAFLRQALAALPPTTEHVIHHDT